MAAIDEKTKKILLGFQQSEINGAVMYSRLAKEFKDGKEKDMLLEMAKDEGRHGSIFYSITQIPLAAQKEFAEAMAEEMKKYGISAFFKKVSDAEYMAPKAYSPYCKDFPVLNSILPDEEKHGRYAKEIAEKSKEAMTISFESSGKTIDLFGTENAGSPLVILNTYSSEGQRVYNECTSLGTVPFTLAAISNLAWNDDMTPWAIPPLSKNDTPCLGKADEYLETLTSTIVPDILGKLGAKPAYLAIAGYSLGGLFALYSSYKSDIFSKVASASGSLWYPDFVDFAQKNDFKRKPDCIYLSLGDTEAKTRNKILAPVQKNTEKLADFYKNKEIPLTFEMNKGNHFTEGEKRMAKGIKWILEN